MRYFFKDKLLSPTTHEWTSLEVNARTLTEPPYILSDVNIRVFKEMEETGETFRSFFGGQQIYTIWK